MVYSSFALDLLSGPTSVAEGVVTVLGTVLLASYLCGLWLVPKAAARWFQPAIQRSAAR